MSAPVKCPICQKHAIPEYKPFCSRRCADVDLNRWLNGSYAIKGQDDESAPIDDEGPTER